MNLFLIDFIDAVIQCWLCGRDEMITNYADHAANERTFLAWVRTGLAVAAFGFLLFKLNVLVDVAAGSSLPHHPAEEAGAFAAIVARYAGLAMVVTGITVIARSCMGFERTRRAIDRKELIRIPQSRAESLLSAALVIAVAVSCLYLVVI
jgi:putative membrane protein